MTKSVIAWAYVTYFCYLLHPVCTGTTFTSKACHGSGVDCARHDLTCNFTQKIAIVDAYYTNNTECGTGLSHCDFVSPDNVKEHGYHKFNNTELMSLNIHCSTKTNCGYRAPRRGGSLLFSVVKYLCTEEQTGSNTGGIVGGVVAIVVAVLVVTLVSVWIIRRRRANSEGEEKTKSLPKDTKPDMPYSLAGDIPKNNYHEIQDLKSQNSDYDYATADGMVLPPTTNSYCSIGPTGKQTAGNSSIASEAEGDYDHLGDKPSPQTSDYDTTASVAPPGHTGEDGYGYNHFQTRTNTQTHQNDYDTAASATKAVAQISTTKRNTDEDDYDHFQRGANAETVSYPYDTASGIEDNCDYSVAGQMK